MILDILLDTISDVVRIIPFLFITYVFMEWMEHQTGHKMERFLEKHRRVAPLAGGLFGLFPECGFSSAASSLYATGVISAGTLIAVYLSTSDEMLPILISRQASISVILPILAVKFFGAIIVGYLIDFFYKPRPTVDIEEFCEREDVHEEEGIFMSALKHTVKITIWLFVLTFIINAVMDSFGMDIMQSFVQNNPTLSVLTCTILGMIPSCASSILLSTLYLDGVIGFAPVCAGLLANAGVGMMILFRVNPNLKKNLLILSYTWGSAFIIGLLLEIFF